MKRFFIAFLMVIVSTVVGCQVRSSMAHIAHEKEKQELLGYLRYHMPESEVLKHHPTGTSSWCYIVGLFHVPAEPRITSSAQVSMLYFDEKHLDTWSDRGAVNICIDKLRHRVISWGEYEHPAFDL